MDHIWAISFNVIEKQGETSTQRSAKRLREGTGDITPEILISNSSSSVIIQEEGNINSNLLTATPPQNQDGLAIKLTCLKEKSARYNSNRDFLSKFIQENLVPKALEITLEPTIGNFD